MVAFSYLYFDGGRQITGNEHGKSNSPVETIKNEILFP